MRTLQLKAGKPNKYMESLKINTSFEEAIKIVLKPKKDNKKTGA